MNWLMNVIVVECVIMRCYNCGKECVLRSSQSIPVDENTYQVKRVYKCVKCDKIFEVVDDPVVMK